MRFVLLLIIIASTLNATETSKRLDALLQQQDSIFHMQHKGVLTLWQSSIPEFKIKKEIVPPPPPPGVTGTGDNITDKLINLSERIAVLEVNTERLLKAVEGNQKMNIDNREFIIKLLNSILTFLGSGGVLGLLVTIYFKTRKKAGTK